MRRAAHEAMNADATDNFYPCQVKEAIILADGLLRYPNGWDDHIKRCAFHFHVIIASYSRDSGPKVGYEHDYDPGI